MGCCVKPAVLTACSFPLIFTRLAEGGGGRSPGISVFPWITCTGVCLGGRSLQRHKFEEKSDAAAPCQAKENWQSLLGHRIFQHVLSWGTCTYRFLRLHALHSLIFPRSRGMFLLATRKWCPVLPGRPRPPAQCSVHQAPLPWPGPSAPQDFTPMALRRTHNKEQGWNSTFQVLTTSSTWMGNPCPR